MFREGLRPPDPFREGHPFEEARTQDGMSLKALATLSPVLVACLPALGALFCREMLHELSGKRRDLEARGLRFVLVHMGTDAEAAGEFEASDLQYLARISDPERKLYAAFELKEATVAQRMGPRVWGRALAARRHGRGPIVGAPAQLPGVFVLSDTGIRHSFRHTTPSDRVDYAAVMESLS